MKHPRTLIREAVAARLIESLPKVDERITASRISIHRSTPLFAGKLPAILPSFNMRTTDGPMTAAARAAR